MHAPLLTGFHFFTSIYTKQEIEASCYDSQTEGSTDSGSVQNTISQMDSEESPGSRKASSELFGKQKEEMASDSPQTNQKLKTQEKACMMISFLFFSSFFLLI